jgi:hypothetical protein
MAAFSKTPFHNLQMDRWSVEYFPGVFCVLNGCQIWFCLKVFSAVIALVAISMVLCSMWLQLFFCGKILVTNTTSKRRLIWVFVQVPFKTWFVSIFHITNTTLEHIWLFLVVIIVNSFLRRHV